ncbi:MAG TPA: peptide chain release factor 1 [candidate division Zixibacteria bacterium]|nr:peptide chain release factor 1 [candidate division Zixibacteria bacterium]
MLLDKLIKIRERYDELTRELSKPEVLSDSRTAARLGREFRELEASLPLIDEYEQISGEIAESEAIIAEADDDMLEEIAREELPRLRERLEELEEKLTLALIPPDPNEGADVIVEIRAGTGGDEAALFAGSLFRMYSKFAERKRLSVSILDSNPTELGGFKEIVFELSGDDAYSAMKFESGVHRVQRVPETESGGRIHTSAASVAVLPAVEDVDIEVNEEDLRIDTYRSSGAGGQHVNKTESAIRITHIPTGIVVTCQDEKSQHKNKAKALVVLKSRLYAKQQEELKAERANERRLQVGSGDRSDKIRTYNYPQNRVTDHRIGYSAHNLPAVLDGDLDNLLEALHKADKEDALKDIG